MNYPIAAYPYIIKRPSRSKAEINPAADGTLFFMTESVFSANCINTEGSLESNMTLIVRASGCGKVSETRNACTD